MCAYCSPVFHPHSALPSLTLCTSDLIPFLPCSLLLFTLPLLPQSSLSRTSSNTAVISSVPLPHLPSSLPPSLTFPPFHALLPLLQSLPSFSPSFHIISSDHLFLPAHHLLFPPLFSCPLLPPLALPDVRLWPMGPLVKLDHVQICMCECVLCVCAWI